MKNVGKLNNGKELLTIIERFVKYQIGIKDYYELLAVEFAKNLDDINFKSKCEILYYLALADIDSQFIYKTTHNICSSYVEALLQKGFDK
jgi:hypothetical protein